MTKKEFISALRARLCGLPTEEIEERLAFYGEMIDDRCEDGLSEEDAVAAIGSLDEVVFEIIEEVPLGKIIKEKIKPKRKARAWKIVLFWVGSPIWISLLAAAFAVVLSLYASLWSVVASVWAAFVSVALTSPAALLSGALCLFNGKTAEGILFVGVALALAGVAILLFIGALYTGKAATYLTKKMLLGIKRCFMGKEKVK